MENQLYNLNIERAILSSILFEPTIYESIAGEIKPESFYLPAHQHIYKAIEELSNEEMPIDEEFIRKKLSKEKNFNENVLLEILASSPLSNTYAYLGELKDLSIKRELIKVTTEIKQSVYEERLESDEALDRIQKRLFEIGIDSQESAFKEAEEIATNALEIIKTNKERENRDVTGLDTGFSGLNKKTHGFGAGDLIIIAARPGMGKTAFVLNLAGHVLKNGKGVAFFSLEMPAEQLMFRMLAARSSVPLQKIKTGDLKDDEWESVANSADQFASSKLFVSDDSLLTLQKLRTKLRRIKQKQPEIALAIIDYLQLMSGGGGNKDRHQEVSDISRGIKMLARELQIPIIALSQLNRGLENRHDKRPMLADIRESGAIEQDADIIAFVHREDVYKAREARERQKRAEAEGKTDVKVEFVEKSVEEAEIIIAKHRNGETGTVKMLFQKPYTRFVDLDTHSDSNYYKDTKIVVDHISMPKPI